jgi:hypothetical protein
MNTDSLIRDKQTNALLNVNKSELDAYRLRKHKMEKIDVLEDDINNLRKELQELKQMMRDILNS